MRIRYDFEYDACYGEIADEFCAHDSKYQAETLNFIGQQFKIWSQDKARPLTYIQLLEIAEDLNDNGKWFIKTLCDYMEDESKSEERKLYEQVGDAMFFLPDYSYNNKTMSAYQFVTEWLSTFNTDSATECFMAVQELKKKIGG